jgi:hypothetical protein
VWLDGIKRQGTELKGVSEMEQVIELCFDHIGLAPESVEVVALPPRSRIYCAACGADRITNLDELTNGSE